jgi:predicted nuclease of predicted toxin-antitoxin system
VKFKVDENLPVEIVDLLRNSNFDVISVVEQGLSGENDPIIAGICQQEDRVLITLDLDFADIRSYPPEQFPGLLVMRLRYQDKTHVVEVFRRVIHLLERETVEHRLWIIEEKRVRIRGESS